MEQPFVCLKADLKIHPLYTENEIKAKTAHVFNICPLVSLIYPFFLSLTAVAASILRRKDFHQPSELVPAKITLKYNYNTSKTGTVKSFEIALDWTNYSHEYGWGNTWRSPRFHPVLRLLSATKSKWWWRNADCVPDLGLVEWCCGVDVSEWDTVQLLWIFDLGPGRERNQEHTLACSSEGEIWIREARSVSTGAKSQQHNYHHQSWPLAEAAAVSKSSQSIRTKCSKSSRMNSYWFWFNKDVNQITNAKFGSIRFLCYSSGAHVCG